MEGTFVFQALLCGDYKSTLYQSKYCEGELNYKIIISMFGWLFDRYMLTQSKDTYSWWNLNVIMFPKQANEDATFQPYNLVEDWLSQTNPPYSLKKTHTQIIVYFMDYFFAQ